MKIRIFSQVLLNPKQKQKKYNLKKTSNESASEIYK